MSTRKILLCLFLLMPCLCLNVVYGKHHRTTMSPLQKSISDDTLTSTYNSDPDINYITYYKDYLNGNKNFILTGGHMGDGFYLDKSSLVIQKNEPSVYRIAVNVLRVPQMDRGNTTSFTVEKRQYLYQWDVRKMYVFIEKENSWHYIYPCGAMYQTGHEFSGEMAFYLAFHKKFYGGRKWWDERDKQYRKTNFGDKLYARADGSD